MNGANQTVTTGNVFRPLIWATDVMDQLKANIVLLPRVKHYEREIKSKGQSVEVPFIAATVVHDKVANTQVTLNDATSTKVSILIDKHKEDSVLIEDILEVQSAYDLRAEYTRELGRAMAEAIDTDIYTELMTTTVEVGTAGTAIVDATVLGAKVKLDEARAPMTDRTIAVSPVDQAAMLAIDKYVRYDALGTGKAIVNGKIGTIYGFEVVMSQLISGAAVAFHKDAIGVALQKRPRTQAQYKQEWLGWLLTVDSIYGIKSLRAGFAVKIHSANES